MAVVKVFTEDLIGQANFKSRYRILNQTYKLKLLLLFCKRYIYQKLQLSYSILPLSSYANL